MGPRFVMALLGAVVPVCLVAGAADAPTHPGGTALTRSRRAPFPSLLRGEVARSNVAVLLSDERQRFCPTAEELDKFVIALNTWLLPSPHLKRKAGDELSRDTGALNDFVYYLVKDSAGKIGAKGVTYEEFKALIMGELYAGKDPVSIRFERGERWVAEDWLSRLLRMNGEAFFRIVHERKLNGRTIDFEREKQAEVPLFFYNNAAAIELAKFHYSGAKGTDHGGFSELGWPLLRDFLKPVIEGSGLDIDGDDRRNLEFASKCFETLSPKQAAPSSAGPTKAGAPVPK